MELYPVGDVHKQLNLPEKRQLIAFFEEEVSLAEKRNELAGVIDSDCPLMQLVKTNFPEVGKVEVVAQLCDILEVIKKMRKAVPK